MTRPKFLTSVRRPEMGVILVSTSRLLCWENVATAPTASSWCDVLVLIHANQRPAKECAWRVAGAASPGDCQWVTGCCQQSPDVLVIPTESLLPVYTLRFVDGGSSSCLPVDRAWAVGHPTSTQLSAGGHRTIRSSELLMS